MLTRLNISFLSFLPHLEGNVKNNQRNRTTATDLQLCVYWDNTSGNLDTLSPWLHFPRQKAMLIRLAVFETTHQHSSSNLLQILNWNSHWLHIQPLEWSIGTKNKIGKLIKNLLIWGNDFIYLIFQRTIYLILRRARTDASWNPSPMAYRMYNLCWGN